MSFVIEFDANRKKRTEAFKYFNCSLDGRKKSNLGENETFMPTSAIIAIENIKIDEVKIYFDPKAIQGNYPPI